MAKSSKQHVYRENLCSHNIAQRPTPCRLAWNARTPGIPARQAGTPQNARSPAQAKIDHHGTPWNATTKTITEIQKCGTPENARTPERTAGTPHSKCRPGLGTAATLLPGPLNPRAWPAQSSGLCSSKPGGQYAARAGYRIISLSLKKLT